MAGSPERTGLFAFTDSEMKSSSDFLVNLPEIMETPLRNIPRGTRINSGYYKKYGDVMRDEFGDVYTNSIAYQFDEPGWNPLEYVIGMPPVSRENSTHPENMRQVVRTKINSPGIPTSMDHIKVNSWGVPTCRNDDAAAFVQAKLAASEARRQDLSDRFRNAWKGTDVSGGSLSK